MRRRVLIACERSGIVRDAFIALGYDAMSADIEPTLVKGPHYQGDVREILDSGWHMLIGFPPCTHLAISGARHFSKKKALQEEALNFFKTLLVSDIPYICLENPVSIASSKLRKATQVIHPWQFGHAESKTTCLWLKNMPKLLPTNIVAPEFYRCRCRYTFERSLGRYGCPNCNGISGPALPKWNNQTVSGQNKLSKTKDRAYLRSRTYTGIAKAMAEQWGPLLLKPAIKSSL